MSKRTPPRSTKKTSTYIEGKEVALGPYGRSIHSMQSKPTTKAPKGGKQLSLFKTAGKALPSWPPAHLSLPPDEILYSLEDGAEEAPRRKPPTPGARGTAEGSGMSSDTRQLRCTPQGRVTHWEHALREPSGEAREVGQRISL